MGEPSYLIGKKGQGEPACGKTGPQSWRVTITLYYYGLHTPDIPLHVLPLCLACRQEIPDVRLLLDVSDFMAPPEGGERERRTRSVTLRWRSNSSRAKWRDSDLVAGSLMFLVPRRMVR